MGSISLSHWWLDCDCYGIFRWFLGCLYLFCGCLVVDAKVNFWIYFYWLLICLLCSLELVRRVFWSLIFVAIIIILIHSCDIAVSNRRTSTVCEDKLNWFVTS